MRFPGACTLLPLEGIGARYTGIDAVKLPYPCELRCTLERSTATMPLLLRSPRVILSSSPSPSTTLASDSSRGIDHTGQVNCSLLPRPVNPVVTALVPRGTTGKRGSARNASHAAPAATAAFVLLGSNDRSARNLADPARQRGSLTSSRPIQGPSSASSRSLRVTLSRRS